MLLDIAVDGCTVEIDLTTASDPSITATVTVIGIPSMKVFAGGKGVLVDGWQITVSAIKTSSATIPDPAPYTIAFSAKAEKTFADGTLVLRKDDISDTLNATPQIPGNPPVNYPVSFNYKITDAGQDKVSAQ